MTEQGSTYEITLEARLDNLPRLRDFVERSCRNTTVDDATCYDIKLAVDEACTNIITHGFENIPPGAITLTFCRDADRIVITIIDNAPPFDPGNVPEPDMDAPWEQRSVGGLGLYLIENLMDETNYSSSGKEAGNRLTLIKRFRPLKNGQPVNG